MDNVQENTSVPEPVALTVDEAADAILSRWETTDAIRAYFEIVRRGSTEVETMDLVRLAGAEIGAISGKWNDFDSGYLEDIESYKLIVEVRLDSSTEFVYLDRMLVYREREN